MGDRTRAGSALTTVRAKFPGDMPKRGKQRKSFEIYTQDRLLLNYRGAIGVKNGWTTKARGTFIGAATRGGRTLIATVMRTDQDAWKQSATLLSWGFANADAVTNEELVELPCDIFAPCALEQVVTEENADRVKATVICEGANGPVTPAADAILEDRGVLVLPDVLANAGGVVVSYFEWVQGLQEYFWREDEVNAKLHDIVARAFEEAWHTQDAHETSLRMASYGLAVQRVAEATTTRGLYP